MNYLHLPTYPNEIHALTLHPHRPVLLLFCVIAIAIALVAVDSTRLSTPFGPSHDGFNAALYMTGGRAILEEGLIASKIGAASKTPWGDQVIYAHHPPMVYLLDAAALALLDSVETAARLPAVVGSLMVVVLSVFLLSAVGLPSAAASAGIIVAFVTPMFFMFGVMTEPHALGLAPMTLLTLLWQRTRRGLEPSAGIFASAAALAALTSWQAGLFAVLVAGWMYCTGYRRAAGAILAAGAATLACIGLWILWAYHGELGDFLQRALHRFGAGNQGRVTFSQMIRQQMQYFADLFPIGNWLVVPFAAIGILDRRTRPLIAVSLGTVLGYALIFRNGAYDHNYWLYCILLPLSLSAAIAADAVRRWLGRFTLLRLAAAALGIALVAATAVSMSRSSGEPGQRRQAASLGDQLRHLSWPAEQRYAYHAFGGQGPTDLMPWVYFYTRRPPYGVEGPHSVPQGQVFLRLVNGRLATVPGSQPNER